MGQEGQKQSKTHGARGSWGRAELTITTGDPVANWEDTSPHRVNAGGVLIELGLLRELQRAEDVIAKDEELTEVAMVMGMVHRVVLGAHDGFRVTPHGIVDVRGPDTREEEQEHVGQVVHRHEEQANDVRAGLQHAINGVEGNGAPRGQGQGFVVLVVQGVHVLVQELVRVQLAVHPVDARLEETEVQKQIGEVLRPATNVRDVEIRLGVATFNQKLGNDGQHRVDQQRRLRQEDLIGKGRPRWKFTTLGSEQAVTEDTIDEEAPHAGRDPVHHGAHQQIAQIGLGKITVLLTQLFVDHRHILLGVNHLEKRLVHQRIEFPVRILRAEVHHGQLVHQNIHRLDHRRHLQDHELFANYNKPLE